MRWKIFQWMKLLFRHSSNSRKLSRQKFHNELACVFTAHYASKNADWNQQQLTDGGILANWNSANHPYCFLSNQKKSPDSSFFACDLWKDCIMPSCRYMTHMLYTDLLKSHNIILYAILRFLRNQPTKIPSVACSFKMQSFHSRENADSRKFYLFSTKNKTAQSHLTSCEIKEILEGYFCWRRR